MINTWKSGLGRTRKSAFGRIASLLGATEINDETWEDLEALLIQADLGVETTEQVVEALQAQTRNEGLTKAYELRDALGAELRSRLIEPPEIDLSADPSVVILVGVNGSGKTTSAAKLSKRYQNQGKKVLLVAADTYRAGAIDQLQVWAERLDIAIILGQPEGDPGAVTYDAIQSALARSYNLLFVDTAGRLHTRFNLMEELKKVIRVAGKALEGGSTCCVARHGCHHRAECHAAGKGFYRSRQHDRGDPGKAGLFGTRRDGFCNRKRPGTTDPFCRTRRRVG